MESVRIFSGNPEALESEINEFLESEPQVKDIKINTISGSEPKMVVLILYSVPDDEF